MKKLIVLSGVTASGKSAYAQQLANTLNTKIIVGDSLQMYSNWPIASNWPKQTNQYHLLGKYDALKTRISAVTFKNDVLEAIKEMNNPIIEGGCCFYLNYLLTSSEETYTNEQIDKADTQAEVLLKQDPKQVLYKYCKSYDGSIPYTDSYRMQKALRYALLSNGEYFKKQQETNTLMKEYDIRLFFLNENQLTLNKKIYDRCDQMIKDGIIYEIHKYFQSNPKHNHSLPIGYNELSVLFEPNNPAYMSRRMIKKVQLDKIKNQIREFYIKSRQYAHYQRKYCRSKLKNAIWIEHDRFQISQFIQQLSSVDKKEFDCIQNSPENKQYFGLKGSNIIENKQCDTPSDEIVDIVYKQIRNIL